MLKQRSRKAVEEVYASKFEASKSPVTVMHQNSGHKTNRVSQHDNGYIISSNAPYNSAALLPPSTATVQKSLNSGKETSRRKSARAGNNSAKEKPGAKETFIADDVKRSATKPTKGEKFTCTNFKDISPEDALQKPQHQHHHHHHRRQHTHRSQAYDEDKDDDDTDEFFDLIRRTVEKAIGKSSELLNRNFRELSSKVDRLAAELKNTNVLLNQMQDEMGSKIGHYGEENSRHFRYLCMKSEYDKMFYQHQTLVANAKPPTDSISSALKKSERRKKSLKSSKSTTKIQCKENDSTNKNESCPCLDKNKCKSSPAASKCTPSLEAVSQKSSEIGMREVLEQIKQFYAQRPLNSLQQMPSSDGPEASHQPNAVLRRENFIQVFKEAFEDEDDANENDDDDDDDDDDEEEWEISSDGMTPRNTANSHGDATSRGGITQRGNQESGDA